MLSEKEKGDIRTSYRQAALPYKQIEILSQLYAVPKEQILDVLGLETMPQRHRSREHMAKMAEMIHDKIMAGTVQPAEDPCKACPLEGCCEMVQCSVKDVAEKEKAPARSRTSDRRSKRDSPQAIPILSESEGKCKA